MLRFFKWTVETRSIFLAPLLAGLLTWGYSIWVHQSVAEDPPADLFVLVDVGSVIAAQDRSPPSDDFGSRPVFFDDRRPLVEIAPEPEQKVQEQAVFLEPLEGMSLVGVFGSEGVRGIIVRPDGEKSHRLLSGEQLNGWEFQDFDGRRATFVDPANPGRLAYLELKFTVASPLPISEAGSVAAEQLASGEPDLQNKTEPSEPADVSFGAMYRDRARRRSERRAEAAESNSASNIEANTDDT